MAAFGFGSAPSASAPSAIGPAAVSRLSPVMEEPGPNVVLQQMKLNSNVTSEMNHLKNDEKSVQRTVPNLYKNYATTHGQELYLSKCGPLASASHILDTPDVQKFDKEVAVLSLGGGDDAMMVTHEQTDAVPGYVRSPLMSTVDISKRKAMKRFYQEISGKMYADWSMLRSKLMSQLGRGMFVGPSMPQQGEDPRGGPPSLDGCPTYSRASQAGINAQADRYVFELLSRPNYVELLPTIKQLSVDMAPQYRQEVLPLWDLIEALAPFNQSGEDRVVGVIDFLQDQFVNHMRATVRRAPAEILIGPREDFYSLCLGYGMLIFREAGFPNKPIHQWFLLYTFLRSGKGMRQEELHAPGDAAVERVRQQVNLKMEGQPVTMRIENTGNGGQFEDFLVSFINDDSPQWDRFVAHDWLWFQMKPFEQLRHRGGSADALLELQTKVLTLPASHFESSFHVVQMYFFTLQFGQGLTALMAHENGNLHATMLHLAVVLQKMKLLNCPEPGSKLDFSMIFVHYGARFGLNEQLSRLRALDMEDKRACLHRLMERPMNGTNELLGTLEPSGRMHPGLLQQAFERENDSKAEFLLLCEKAGYAALEQGQYREALKLLFNARKYHEVLSAMARALRLPLMAPGAGAWDMGLREELRIFYQVFDNVGYQFVPNLSTIKTWHTVRRLMAVDMFYEKASNCDEALAFFDEQRFFDNLEEEDLMSEYPKLLSAYVSVLYNAFKSPAYQWPALADRVKRLQEFMANHEGKIAVSAKLRSDIAALALKWTAPK